MIYMCEDRKFIEREFTRLGFDRDGQWRISDINKNHQLCNTYPRFLIIPSSFKDEDLEAVAKFRYFRRIPVAVWRHLKNGCFIARTSQPSVGWFGWCRSDMDELLINQFVVNTITSTNSDTKNKSHHSKSGTTNSTESDVIATTTTTTIACPTDTTTMNQLVDKSSTTTLQTSELNEEQHIDSNIDAVDNSESDTSSKVIIIDARSYTAAMANRAKGGGCEHSEYYQRCEIQFMDLANIHSIRKSFQYVRSACEAYTEECNSWFNFLDNSRWLHHISALIKSALLIVDTLDIERKSILIHCSDGWDRTPQLVALAEIMLDPHFRTFEGFQSLVKREWLDFGHKFADRCGSTPCNPDVNERSPVFLQWLDCVQQMFIQYPTHFEFNSAYLDKMNRHTNSNIFGTFSHNSTQERIASRVEDRHPSLWDYFQLTRKRYTNDKYCPNQDIIRPSYKLRDLHFWLDLYKVNQSLMDKIFAENSQLEKSVS